MSKLANFLENMNLSLDNESELVYGNWSGFPLVLTFSQKNVVSEIVFSVARQGQLLTTEDGKSLTASSEAIANVLVNGSLVRVIPKSSMTTKKRYDNVQQAIEDSVRFFQQGQISSVCQLTGQEGVNIYLVGSGAQFLSSDGVEQQRANLLSKETEQNIRKEQFVPGIVGAFLGSLVGVLVTVIIGQLGYVAVVSGIVMGVATLKGYEFLAKRLSIKGIIVSSLIMIAMTYFAFHLDWAFAVARLVEVDVFTAFQAIPYLLETGDIPSTDYMTELFKLYLFTLLGAVPTILSTMKQQKIQFHIRQLT